MRLTAGQLSGAALAHVGRVGLHAVRKCPRDRSQSRWTILSAMLAKATSGTFPQDSLTRPGLGPDGSEFMLIFNQGTFSEDNTFLLSDWVRHTPPSVLSKKVWVAGERS